MVGACGRRGVQACCWAGPAAVPTPLLCHLPACMAACRSSNTLLIWCVSSITICLIALLQPSAQAMGLRPQFFLHASSVGRGEAAPVPAEVLEALEVFVMAPEEVAARLQAALEPKAGGGPPQGGCIWRGVGGCA